MHSNVEVWLAAEHVRGQQASQSQALSLSKPGLALVFMPSSLLNYSTKAASPQTKDDKFRKNSCEGD